VNKCIIFAAAAIVVVFTSSPTESQTQVNPDISFIGDSRLSVKQDAPPEIGNNGLEVDFHELEITATGYLNPFSRADVCLGMHGTEGPIEIEEASATLLRGLPLNLQLKIGQYLVDFGKLNTQHSHQWSWMGRPLMHQAYFGGDGLRDVGLNISTFLPVGLNALTISANLLQGDFFGGHHHDDDGEEHDEETDYELGGSSRISVFTSISDLTSLEAGVSGLYGQHDPEHDCRTAMGNLDLKLKWRPDMYRSLMVVAEVLVGHREVLGDTLNHSSTDKVISYGLFAAADYQFRRRYDIGGFVDYAQDPDDNHDERIGFGLFAGFSLAEETYRVGLLLRHDDGTDFDNAFQTVILQFLWSLGPHKPHAY
jgi:hypothetical protein